VRANNAVKANMPPFAAAVAYYGGCVGQKFQLATDLLILFGESDDWGNVKACGPMLARQDKATKARLTIVTYPGAYHDFDNRAAPTAGLHRSSSRVQRGGGQRFLRPDASVPRPTAQELVRFRHGL
jgi:dienelactone hydrolase